MQKATRNRVVDYHNPLTNEINTAIIVGVYDDETVALAAWTCKAAPYSVERCQLGEGPGRWSWPVITPSKPSKSEPAGPQS